MIKFSKYCTIFLFSLTFLTFNQCYYSGHHSSHNTKKVKVKRDSFKSAAFQEPRWGNYYIYNFNKQNRIDDIAKFLSYLSSKGAVIEAAWYYSGGGCGNGRVFIKPQLFVKLEKNEGSLTGYNFSSFAGKPELKCLKSTGYYIRQ